MGNVRNGCMSRSFMQGSSLPPSWTTAARVVNRVAAHAFAAVAVSSEKSCTATANARKSSRKSYRQREHAIN